MATIYAFISRLTYSSLPPHIITGCDSNVSVWAYHLKHQRGSKMKYPVIGQRSGSNQLCAEVSAGERHWRVKWCGKSDAWQKRGIVSAIEKGLAPLIKTEKRYLTRLLRQQGIIRCRRAGPLHIYQPPIFEDYSLHKILVSAPLIRVEHLLFSIILAPLLIYMPPLSCRSWIMHLSLNDVQGRSHPPPFPSQLLRKTFEVLLSALPALLMWRSGHWDRKLRQ